MLTSFGLAGRLERSIVRAGEPMIAWACVVWANGWDKRLARTAGANDRNERLEQKSGIICVKGLEGRKPKMSTSYSSSARSEEVAVEIQICSEYLKEAYPDLFDIKFGVYFFKWLYELTEMDALRKEVEHAVEQSQGLIPNGWSLWVNVQLKITGG